MADLPLGNLDNPAVLGRFKHYSRPAQYAARPKPQLFSDVTDQFTQIYQAGIDSSSPQPISQTPKPNVNPLIHGNTLIKGQNHQAQAVRRPAQVGIPIDGIIQPIQPIQTKPVEQRDETPQPVQQAPVQPQQQYLQPEPMQQVPNQPQPAPQQYYQPQPALQEQPVNFVEPVQLAPSQVEMQLEVYYEPQTLAAEETIIQQNIPQDNPVISLQMSQPEVIEQYQQPPVQIPTYENNYNNEYEDVKSSRLRLFFQKFKKKTIIVGSSAAMVIVLAGGFMFFMTLNHNNIAQAQASHPSGNNGTISLPANKSNASDYASAIAPTATQIANYSVSATLPKYLIVPKLKIDAMIDPVGLDNNNRLNAPNNIFNVGWWQASSQPGQTGATVLDGFTNNGTSPGLFAALADLAPGDTFKLQTGNNTVLNYVVVKTVEYGTNGLNMDQAISPVSSTQSGLNIITCTGQTLTCPSTSNPDFVVFSQEL
jgi:sortase (surface protein transpeptidase)